MECIIIIVVEGTIQSRLSYKNCEDRIVTDRSAKDHLSKEDQVA